MKPPSPITHYADPALDGECTVEVYIQAILDEGAHRTWGPDELMEAILHVTNMMLSAEESDAKPRQIH